MASGGGDVFGTADALHYAYRAVTGDTTFVARVDAVENTHNAAKAGLIFRQDLTPGGKMAAIMVNAGGGYGIDVRGRTAAGAGASYQQVRAGVAAPYWLKLARAGGTITASYSADGVTWTQAATLNVGLAGTFYVGLANTSANGVRLNTSTFSAVTVGAPVVTAVPEFRWQTAPQAVVVTFDRDVAGDVSADDLLVRNDTTGQTVTELAFAYDAATRTATFSYTGTAGPGTGILPDGNYTAMLRAAGFGGTGGWPLDGNADGTPGDDLALTFFQLVGDADRNRQVALNDLVILANHYGMAATGGWADGDFDGNGQVGLNDLVQLANRYGSKLDPASPPAPPADSAATAAVAPADATAVDNAPSAAVVPSPTSADQPAVRPASAPGSNQPSAVVTQTVVPEPAAAPPPPQAPPPSPAPASAVAPSAAGAPVPAVSRPVERSSPAPGKSAGSKLAVRPFPARAGAARPTHPSAPAVTAGRPAAPPAPTGPSARRPVAAPTSPRPAPFASTKPSTGKSPAPRRPSPGSAGAPAPASPIAPAAIFQSRKRLAAVWDASGD
ncbi:MAG TPA: hypothetical protein VEA69_13845 [Tepidisphaeraceae bacterium]|nr:hypothetical protein [Tepidisphaeraceae bacterium]